MTIIEEINDYLLNLAPHIKKREAAKLLQSAVKELEAANKIIASLTKEKGL